jgi:hypothetical protein
MFELIEDNSDTTAPNDRRTSYRSNFEKGKWQAIEASSEVFHALRQVRPIIIQTNVNIAPNLIIGVGEHRMAIKCIGFPEGHQLRPSYVRRRILPTFIHPHIFFCCKIVLMKYWNPPTPRARELLEAENIRLVLWSDFPAYFQGIMDEFSQQSLGA